MRETPHRSGVRGAGARLSRIRVSRGRGRGRPAPGNSGREPSRLSPSGRLSRHPAARGVREGRRRPTTRDCGDLPQTRFSAHGVASRPVHRHHPAHAPDAHPRRGLHPPGRLVRLCPGQSAADRSRCPVLPGPARRQRVAVRTAGTTSATGRGSQSATRATPTRRPATGRRPRHSVGPGVSDSVPRRHGVRVRLHDRAGHRRTVRTRVARPRGRSPPASVLHGLADQRRRVDSDVRARTGHRGDAQPVSARHRPGRARVYPELAAPDR